MAWSAWVERRQKRRFRNVGHFSMDESGKYVYRGVLLRYREEGRSLTGFRVLFGGLTLAAAALILAAGVVPAAGMRRGFLVVIPYVFSLAAVFITLLKCARLLLGGDPIREYVYEETALQLPVYAPVSAACCGLSVLCELLYLAAHGAEGQTAATVEFLILEAAAGLAMLLIRRAVKTAQWDEVREKQEEEP